MQKKSVQLMGHKTSVSLEPAFWQALALIAKARKTSVRQLIIETDIHPHRIANLSSALRVFVLRHKDEFQWPILPEINHQEESKCNPINSKNTK